MGYTLGYFMVPYIHIPDLHIGPLPLHPFGILVATGVLIGTSVTTSRARVMGYDVLKLNSFVTWMLVSAFVLSHMLDSLFYHWDELVRRPWSIFMLWEGLSSFGGFVGAIVGAVLWKYVVVDDKGWPHVRARPAPLLPFADLVMSVFPLAWVFGRAGCASVHDHPGARATADTLLAVAYPLRHGDGVVTKLGFIEFVRGHDPRFDLGFLEMLFAIVLAACFALTWRRRVAIGTYIIAAGLAYAPVRFVMDFLRIPEVEGGDTRYASLTPAQWACIFLFAYALFMIFYVRRLGRHAVDLAADVRAESVGTEGALRAEATG
ncbi:MAG: prolipoprotein diacylglyceryl transferase [Polyangiaceae bacterium]